LSQGRFWSQYRSKSTRRPTPRGRKTRRYFGQGLVFDRGAAGINSATISLIHHAAGGSRLLTAMVPKTSKVHPLLSVALNPISHACLGMGFGLLWPGLDQRGSEERGKNDGARFGYLSNRHCVVLRGECAPRKLDNPSTLKKKLEVKERGDDTGTRARNRDLKSGCLG
jgi:hypothetical protein